MHLSYLSSWQESSIEQKHLAITAQFRRRVKEKHSTLQWGRATVMMSTALTSSKRTICPVRANLALTANFVMRPLMRCGKNQVRTTKVWLWAYAVRLVTRPGAAGCEYTCKFSEIYMHMLFFYDVETLELECKAVCLCMNTHGTLLSLCIKVCWMLLLQMEI